MQLRIRCTVDGAETDVLTTPWSVMEWENACNIKMSAVFDSGLGMGDLLRLAWEAHRAAGLTVPQFPAWAKSVQAIKLVADETRPTEAAASAD